MINPKLKAYIRLDHSGRMVAGSVIYRKSQPKSGRWLSLGRGYPCCDSSTEIIDADVTADSHTLVIGDTTNLHFFLRKSNGQTEDVTADATFVSSDPSVVSISGTSATAVADGIATITGHYEDLTTSIGFVIGTDNPNYY